MTAPSSDREQPVSVPWDAGALLREERAELLGRIAYFDADMALMFEASRDSNADDEHDPEGQTIAYERSQLSALTGHAREQLREIEAALERVGAGTYGVCEVCGRPIAAGRLEARPTARTCVEHGTKVREARARWQRSATTWPDRAQRSTS